jgi:hypothetical protein
VSYTAATIESKPTGADILEAARADREERGLPDDLAVKQIRVNGVPLYIRRFTDEQYAALFAWKQRCPCYSPVKLAARLMAMSVCDKDGNLIYSVDDAVAIGRSTPLLALAEINRRIAEWNGLAAPEGR